MKLNKFALTLTVAALLPSLAYAGTDAITASFERDLQRSIAIEALPVTRTAADPLVDAISVALYGTADQILASFERELNREPAI